jgi:hypothetical protein
MRLFCEEDKRTWEIAAKDTKADEKSRGKTLIFLFLYAIDIYVR